MENTVEEIVVENSDEIIITARSKRRSKEEVYKDAVIKRFSNAPWAVKRTVTLGGAGGIGSNVAYTLIKLGYDINLFEFDTIEVHNVGAQHFNLEDVGRTKAFAIADLAGKINKRVVVNTLGRVTEDTPTDYIMPITFSGFDSIDARKILFEKWYEKFKDSTEAIFIDGRLSAEDFEVFAVTPDKADEYRETLFTEPSEELPCNYKSTTQVGLLIAGMMIVVMTNFITEMIEPMDIRVVPFHTVFNAPLMYFESV